MKNIKKYLKVYDNIVEMNNNTAADSQRSEFKSKFVSGNSNEEIAVSLNYLSKFWRTLKMPVIICEINLILTY